MRRLSFVFARCTAFLRPVPSFIIIGAQKAGTTSLYNYLIQHPCVKRGLHKELHYFDLYYRKPLSWYRANFALRFPSAGKQCFATGESTPYYLFHPHAPERMAGLLSGVKLLALLRNPVGRAYSHYCHNMRAGREGRPFEEAIADEQARMPAEVAKMAEDRFYDSPFHRHFSYLNRGVYVDQIKNWHKYFDRNQLLVMKSEDMFASPEYSYSRVLDFLGLPQHKCTFYDEYNKQAYSSNINPETKIRLEEFYRPHNRRLAEYLGSEFSWI